MLNKPKHPTPQEKLFQQTLITVIIFLKKRGEKSKSCLSLLQSSD
ncbi:hypothetical protein [Microcystis aeruginosa]|nr:hypothetical protein [Microcystis aeruginosa]